MDSLVSAIRAKQGDEYKGISKCLLAYSGGMDSQAIGSILGELGIEVVPLVIDMGGGNAQETYAEAKKLFNKAKLVDIRPRLRESCFRAIKANCLLAGHLNAGGLTRPLMAQAMAEAAHAEGISCAAHGSSGVGNDHIRMELALRVLGPDLRILAPVRDWNLHRDDALAYAKRMGWKHGEIGKEYSIDESLWARIARQGRIVDADAPIPDDALQWVSKKQQKEKTLVEISFLNGIPDHVKISQGKRKKEAGREGLIELLNIEAGMQGIGKRDVVVEKIIGLKMRELHECPAAEVLVAAHKDIERITMTSSELEAKAWVDRLWNHVVYEGGWFSRMRRHLDAFIDSAESAVDGTVRLEMHNGALNVAGRNSPRALYDSRLGRRDKEGVLNQKAAAGFAKIYGLQDTMAYLLPLE